VQGACKINNTDFKDSRIVIYGAGAAGLGIARQLRKQFSAMGFDERGQTAAVLVMDSRGIVSDGRDNLDSYKQEFAWPEAMVAELGLDEPGRKSLAKVVAAFKASALIGASGQKGAFDEAVVTAMASNCSEPAILPMSNPTAISEAVPEDVLNWSDGRALIATGSPFGPVTLASGTQTIGQANNVFVFPGIGLGAIASGAREITDGMISASASSLAECLNGEDIRERRLIPDISRLWDVCGDVAIAVAKQAVDDGVSEEGWSNADIQQRVESIRWKPSYPQIQSTVD
jgi:malate dehydrogenase (oxaloacetate-decarboxylating)